MHSSFFVSAAGFSWLVLMLLLLMIRRHPSGGGMIVLASSTNDNQRGVVQSLLRGGEMSNRHLNTNNNNSGRSNTNNNSNGDTDDSGDGGDGSVKIRTTTSYRMFQLRATSMILNRVNTTISSAPSIEEDEGVGNDVYHDEDSSKNNASTNITQQQYPIQLRLPSCPPPYDPKNSNHRAGDTVEVYNTIFVCQPSPYDIYCNVDTLEEALLEQSQQQQLNEEEITMLWLHAWKEVGPCTPPSSSTSVPASTSSILPGTSSSMTTRIPSRRPTTTTTTSATTTQTTTPIPTTYYPTYHPTYSPTSTNDWPTYVPTSSPSWMP